ncbi:cobyric acid synthase [Arachnia propionica]|jgi:cobyric acid synthase cobQ|uniref:Cobyric acid synthase n=1 Tax=Arachnia propionica TaxID=1750 RepID=A0AB37HRK0_9ACTN|nr:cobyric acid synthase [Arachnia propionica]AFN47763.1 cobyric acid synthase CobQ [Arachnia propionica F0230a]QCT37469.1 cobyric acid synthase [Arachnia propionica]QUC10176.1 cobyric acid synthase [Arachnia propionica]QUC15142.1 cobyric acid synthase [Arachnia propionica]RPA17088.1 cobyric acid synthase [Arachnia propionica]
MTGLLIAGTASDAGKSLIVTGLARAFRRRGIRVAPFKSQNMSNNSMVCSDGTEIGRAQYLQAQAAGVEPGSLLNPVLLKPGSDRRSFVVLRGRPAGELGAGEYASGRKHLAAAAFEAYEELAAGHDLVLCEGAGSPAEINLRRGDYVNFGLAERFGLPVVLAADIDRGGALAAIFGTHGIVSEQDRGRLAGYLINKFRGDQAVLDPGLDELTRRTGLRNYGVLPWLADVWLDGEDALTIGSRALRPGTGVLHVAVVHFPRTSNATDVDALAAEPGVQVVVTASPDQVARADLAVLPGSRATVTDLAWLREKGLAEAIRIRARQQRPVLGICGGYQMLTDRILDDLESGDGDIPGLGLLPGEVRFGEAKVLGRPSGTWRGEPVEGYTIHHGRVHASGGKEFCEGQQIGATFGTMWHGAFESDGFRRAFLEEIARLTGSDWRPSEGAPGYAEQREAMIERLADACEDNLDVPALLDAAR